MDDNSDRCTCCHNSKILTRVFAPTAAELAKSSKLALQHDKERALALHIVRFPEALVATLEELAPHRLTEYLYDLSDIFNSFYVEHKVRYAMFLLCLPFRCCVSGFVLAFWQPLPVHTRGRVASAQNAPAQVPDLDAPHAAQPECCCCLATGHECLQNIFPCGGR